MTQPLRRLRRHLPIKWGGVEYTKNEAAPAADTASTGRPPGDTRLVSAPLYGRCLLLEANLCVNCRRTRTENELPPTLRRSEDNVKRVDCFAATTFEVGRWQS